MTSPDLGEVVPQRCRLFVERLVRVLDEILGDGLEGVAVVLRVFAVRKQFAIFGVHLEQHPEEDPQGELVSEVEALGIHLVVEVDELFGDSERQAGDDLFVDLVP